jgi:hypothetical protein
VTPLATYQGACPKIVWENAQPWIGLDGLPMGDSVWGAYDGGLAGLGEFFVRRDLSEFTTIDPSHSYTVRLLSRQEGGGGVDVIGVRLWNGTIANDSGLTSSLAYHDVTLVSGAAGELFVDIGHFAMHVGAAAIVSTVWAAIYDAEAPAAPGDPTGLGGIGVGASAAPGAFLAEIPINLTTGAIVINGDASLAASCPPVSPESAWCGPRPIGPVGLFFGFPLDAARSWTAPTPGSETATYPSGEEDAWIEEEDAFLEGTVRHIPAEDMTTSYGQATGWNSLGGWQNFLAFARHGGSFEFWRNRDVEASKIVSYLVEPTDGPPEIDSGLYRRLTLRIRSANTSRYTGY